MICRNCSAVVEDGCTKCPSCGCDPGKRGSGRKNAFAVIIVAFSLIIISIVIALAVSGQLALPASAPTGQTTTAFFVLDSTAQSTQKASEETAETTKPDKKENEKEESKTEPETEKETEASKDKQYDIKTYDVTDKSGKSIAERAVIKAKKKDFTENGKKNLDRIRSDCLDGNDFSWFTVDFEDSTGIVFLSGSKDAACYGIIDTDGMIKELFGCIVISQDSDYSYFPVSKDETTEESSTEKTKETEKDDKSDTDKETTTEKVKSTEESKTEEDKETTKKTTEKKAEKTTSEKKSEKENSNSVVYITATGKKFHRAGCSSLSKSKIEIDRKDAVNDGYEPCKKCNP